MLLKQSTARNLHVFMTDAADHVSGKTGLTLTIKASKDGAAFATITPTVTELESGWYSLALTTTHTNTLGDFSLHITSSGADPTDLVRQVVSSLPGDAVTLSGDFTSTMKTSIGTAVAASAVASVTGNVGGNVTGSVGSVTGNVGGNVVGSVASVTARVTANTDQFAGQTVTAAAGVTFPTSVASPTNITAASGVALTSAYDAAKTAATQASVDVIDGIVDSILVDTAEIGVAGVGLTNLGDTRIAHLDADVSSVGGGSITVQDIVDGVWDEATTSHTTAGTMGKAITDAQSAGDPWATMFDGFSAGEILSLLAAKNLGKTIIVKQRSQRALVTFRAIDDSEDRVVGQMDHSERESVTLTP